MSYPGSRPMKEVVPGAGSLVEYVDKKILVWLRDGRVYVGVFRSVDTFANLLLHNTVERIQVGNDIGDVPLGVVIVRGENVALLGEIGQENDIHTEQASNHHENYTRHSTNDLIAFLAKKEEKKEKIHKLKVEAYLNRGMIYTPEDYF